MPSTSPPDRIYFDNAATSFPKPPEVIRAMTDYAAHCGASPGRGAYAEARTAGEQLTTCRRRICQLIGADTDKPEHVIFTLNTTDALNLAIHGYVRDGDHVITTWMDHNSILRPFSELASRRNVQQTRVHCDSATGLVDPNAIAEALRPNTSLIAVLHGSNVTGTLQPIAAIGAIARQAGVALLVDAAQSLGHVPINVKADCIDMLAFPGHKGLLGPLGTGGLYIKPGIERRLHPVRHGGTGSVSEHDIQPTFLPDCYEAGSHNAIGIIGLSEGVKWLLDRGVDVLRRDEQQLMALMIQRLQQLENTGALAWYGPRAISNRCGVFALRIKGYDKPQQLSNALEEQFGLLTRSGLHCAPLAHRTFGVSERGGMTRFSFGPFTTPEHVEYACDALATLCRHRTAVRPGRPTFAEST